MASVFARLTENHDTMEASPARSALPECVGGGKDDPVILTSPRTYVNAKPTDFFLKLAVTPAVAESLVSVFLMKKVRKVVAGNTASGAGSSGAHPAGDMIHIDRFLRDSISGNGLHAASQLKELKVLASDEFGGILRALETLTMTYDPEAAEIFASASNEVGPNKTLQVLASIGAIAKILGAGTIGSPETIEDLGDTLLAAGEAIRRTQTQRAWTGARQSDAAGRVRALKGDQELAVYEREATSGIELVLGKLDAASVSTSMVVFVEALIGDDLKFNLQHVLPRGAFGKVVKVVTSNKSSLVTSVLKKLLRHLEAIRGCKPPLDTVARIVALEASDRDLRLLASGDGEVSITNETQMRMVAKNLSTIAEAVGLDFFSGTAAMVESVFDMALAESGGQPPPALMSKLISLVVLPNLMANMEDAASQMIALGTTHINGSKIQERFRPRLNALVVNCVGWSADHESLGQASDNPKRPAAGNSSEPRRMKLSKKPGFCKPYLEGSCSRGENCIFNHKSATELKSELCPILRRGQLCTFGQGCVYSHAATVKQPGPAPSIQTTQLVIRPLAPGDEAAEYSA